MWVFYSDMPKAPIESVGDEIVIAACLTVSVAVWALFLRFASGVKDEV